MSGQPFRALDRWHAKSSAGTEGVAKGGTKGGAKGGTKGVTKRGTKGGAKGVAKGGTKGGAKGDVNARLRGVVVKWEGSRVGTWWNWQTPET